MKISGKNRKFFSLFVISTTYFWSNFHKLSMSVLAPHLILKCNISTSQIGELGSILFFIYAILQIPLGKLADKFGSKIIYKFELLFLTIGTFFFATADSYAKLLIGRFLIGFAIAGFYIPGLNLITKWFDTEDYNYYAGIFLSSGLAGALFASAPLEFLISKFSFETIFMIATIFAGIDFLLSFFLDPGENQNMLEKKAPQNKSSIPKDVLKLAISGGIYGLVYLGARQAFSGTWANAYYTSIFKMNNQNASFMLMLFSLGGIVAAPLLGKFADNFGRYKALIAIALTTVTLWVLMGFLNYETPLFLTLLITVLLGGFSNMGGILVFSLLIEYTDDSNQATINGISNTFAIMGGSIYTQALGMIFENTVFSQEIFLKIFISFAALILLALLYLISQKKKLDKNSANIY